jgi:hypothetical protein
MILVEYPLNPALPPPVISGVHQPVRVPLRVGRKSVTQTIPKGNRAKTHPNSGPAEAAPQCPVGLREREGYCLGLKRIHAHDPDNNIRIYLDTQQERPPRNGVLPVWVIRTVGESIRAKQWVRVRLCSRTSEGPAELRTTEGPSKRSPDQG